MTDRELLELAAKAAGYDVQIIGEGENAYGLMYPGSAYTPMWNPLTNDGDALRLAVKLKIQISYDFNPPDDEFVQAIFVRLPDIVASCSEGIESDPYTATRRAIVRAAAEIGKGMK